MILFPYGCIRLCEYFISSLNTVYCVTVVLCVPILSPLSVVYIHLTQIKLLGFKGMVEFSMLVYIFCTVEFMDS